MGRGIVITFTVQIDDAADGSSWSVDSSAVDGGMSAGRAPDRATATADAKAALAEAMAAAFSET